jgi:hypothetical protein
MQTPETTSVIEIRLDPEPAPLVAGPSQTSASKAKASFGRMAGIALAVAILAGGLVASVSLLSTSTSSAAVASTEHALPTHSAAGVTFPCNNTAGYACTPGYTGTNATGWAAEYYGCPDYAAGCAVGTPHNCTLYAAFKLMQNGYPNPHWSANASDWAKEAADHGVLVNQSPAVGAIAQWNGGHVAYVESSNSSGITLTMDAYYTESPWPNGYTAEIHIAPGSPAWPDNFIHFDDQNGSNTPSPSASSSSTPQSSPVVTIVNASGGIYWRSTTDWNSAIRVNDTGVWNGDRVALLCYQRGLSNTPPYYNNPLWYQATVVQGRVVGGQGWVNDHFLDTGVNVPNVVVSGVPACGSAPAPATTSTQSAAVAPVPAATPTPAAGSNQPVGATALQPAAGTTQLQNTSNPQASAGGSSSPVSTPNPSAPPVSSTSSSPSNSGPTQPAQAPAPAPSPATPSAPVTYGETVGSVAHTWSNYEDAGGTQGPEIGSNQTVQIACKVQGFTVADGNTWWYRIASSPWNDAFYVSADAFYNNGETSGSLIGTPFVDQAVPNC